MWIDADAVITNPAQRLEDLVDDNVDFLVAQDKPPRPLNTGVFLLRNSPSVLDMLRRAYAKVRYTFHPMWEQPALSDALRECFDTVRTRIVPRHLLNAFACENEKGDFILHFAGLTPEQKLAGVKKAIAQMRAQPPCMFAASDGEKGEDRGRYPSIKVLRRFKNHPREAGIGGS